MDDNADIVQYLRNLLKEYYSKSHLYVDRIEQREFGFGGFNRKIDRRHMAFKNTKELKEYVVSDAPFFVSYSTAYYNDPAGRPMENKGWLGSELVFDLDVTDMNIPCRAVHPKDWVCKSCFTAVKEETLKLIEDFLIPDFGFSDKDIKVNFSGNRGYHVHVSSEDVLRLREGARKQISNYITGHGLSFQKFFPTSGQKGKALLGPKPADLGWGGKISSNFLKAMGNGIEGLMKLGIEREVAVRLYKKRALVEMGIKNGNWDMVYIKKKQEFWQRIVEAEAIMQSDKIDRNVTIETSHLIRLPDTIHGSTGLVSKALVSTKSLSSFEPMDECIAFNNNIELKIVPKITQEIYMNGQVFELEAGKQKSIPIYVAIYLYLKGFAEITIK